MVAHGARSLLVKLLNMKMWDGSLIKYYISSLVCPLSRTWEFTVNSLSFQPQDFLDPKNSLAWREQNDQIEFELASWWGKLESSLFLLLPTTRRQYYHRLHRCHGNFFTCYCRQPVDNTIIAYIVVTAIFLQSIQVNMFWLCCLITTESSWLRPWAVSICCDR